MQGVLYLGYFCRLYKGYDMVEFLPMGFSFKINKGFGEVMTICVHVATAANVA